MSYNVGVSEPIVIVGVLLYFNNTMVSTTVRSCDNTPSRQHTYIVSVSVQVASCDNCMRPATTGILSAYVCASRKIIRQYPQSSYQTAFCLMALEQLSLTPLSPLRSPRHLLSLMPTSIRSKCTTSSSGSLLTIAARRHGVRFCVHT